MSEYSETQLPASIILSDDWPEEINPFVHSDSPYYVGEYSLAVGALVKLRQQQDEHQSALNLMRETATDETTGLLTRQAFNLQLRKRLHLHDREADPDLESSLVLVDVDHFKHVNDTAGHTVGDSVLEAIGNVLRGATRSDDLIGRYGGEELLIFLHNTPPQNAKQYLDRLRELLDTAEIEGWNEPVTISIGVAKLAPKASEDEIATAFAEADAAMYHAKDNGRNNAVIFSQGTLQLVYGRLSEAS